MIKIYINAHAPTHAFRTALKERQRKSKGTILAVVRLRELPQRSGRANNLIEV